AGQSNRPNRHGALHAPQPVGASALNVNSEVAILASQGIARTRITDAIAVVSWSVLTAVTVKLLSQLTLSDEEFIGAVTCLIFFVLLLRVGASPSADGSNPSIFQSLLMDKSAR